MSRNGVIAALPLCVCLLAGTAGAQGLKAYWTDGVLDEIMRVTIDDQTPETLTNDADLPRGLELDLPNGHVYWVDAGQDTVKRANLDGTNVVDLVTSLDNPFDLALDIPAGKMYWSDQGDFPRIERANLDGSNVEVVAILQPDKDSPAGLDHCGDFVYWVDSGTPNRLMRSMKESGAPEEVFPDIGSIPTYLAVDCEGGMIYWTDLLTGEISRISINPTDGSEVEVLFNTTDPRGIWLDPDGPFPGQAYWVTSTAIQRGNINGTGPITDIYTLPGGASPEGLGLDTGCGDGIVTLGKEECDDGNIVAIDGCSSTCQLEPFIFVDVDAPGPNQDGLTWCTAYGNLQDALDAAALDPSMTVLVAGGEYIPDTSGLGDPRDASFSIGPDVVVLGAYGGCGSPAASVRNLQANPTTLSGDLNGNDDGVGGGIADNVRHVLDASNSNANTVLDGFIITGGNSNALSNNDGAGILCDGGSFELRNATVMFNFSSGAGAGMSVTGGASPTIVQSVFMNNASSDNGGAIGVDDADVSLANVTFRVNTANSGGAISVFGASNVTIQNAVFAQNNAQAGGGGAILTLAPVTVVNGSFNGNTASGVGGAFRMTGGGSALIENSIVWGNFPDEVSGTATINFSDIQGGFAGTMNIDQDPEFVSPPSNLRISAMSPAYDQGSDAAILADFGDVDENGNTVEQTPLDFVGALRIVNVAVDMGAYEVGCNSVADCADLDLNGIRDDNCVFWQCAAGICQSTNLSSFADMGGSNGACPIDQTADGNDRFHALNCFSNSTTTGMPGYPCEPAPPGALNVDAGGISGTCPPDGVCDGNDAFHALNEFAGINTCSCSGPAPLFVQPGAVSAADIRLSTDKRHHQPGDLVVVTARLGAGIKDLRGYQLHAQVSGGKQGRLELVDLTIQDLPDAAFNSLGAWRAFNASTAQLLTGLDADGVAVESGAYLATFVYRASPDAAGRFTIELLHDRDDPQHRTFLFPTRQQDGFDIHSRALNVQIGRRSKRFSQR